MGNKMIKKGLWGLLALILLGTVYIVFFQDNETKQKNNFTVVLINPNPGSEKIDESFVTGLQDYGRREGWQLDFLRC